MYIEHYDSKRRRWVFNIPFGKEQARIFARFLWELTKLGKVESLSNPAAMPVNARLRDVTERIVLTALSRQYHATVEDYYNANQSERFVL